MVSADAGSASARSRHAGEPTIAIKKAFEKT
jgi:hypothetical protein